MSELKKSNKIISNIFLEIFFSIVSSLSYISILLCLIAFLLIYLLFDIEIFAEWFYWYFGKYGLWVFVTLLLSGNFSHKKRLKDFKCPISTVNNLVCFIARPLFLASCLLMFAILTLNDLKNIDILNEEIIAYEANLIKLEGILDNIVNLPIVICLVIFCFLIYISIFYPKYRIATKLFRVKRTLSQFLICLTFINSFAFTIWKKRNYFKELFENHYKEQIIITTSNIINIQTRLETIKELNKVIEGYPPNIKISLKSSIFQIYKNKDLIIEKTIKEVDEVKRILNFKISISDADIEKINTHGFVDELVGNNNINYINFDILTEDKKIFLRYMELNSRLNQRENSLKAILQGNEYFKKCTNEIIESYNKRAYIEDLTRYETLLKNRYIEVSKTFNNTINNILGDSFDLFDSAKGKNFVQVFLNQIIDVVQKRYANPKIFKLIKQWDNSSFKKIIGDSGFNAKSLANEIKTELKTLSQENIFTEQSNMPINNNNASKRINNYILEYLIDKKYYYSFDSSLISFRNLKKIKPKINFKLRSADDIIKSIVKAIF